MRAARPYTVGVMTVVSVGVCFAWPNGAFAQDAGNTEPSQQAKTGAESEPIVSQPQPGSPKTEVGANPAPRKPVTQGAANLVLQRRDLNSEIVLIPRMLGYCPVSYFEKGKAVVGDPKFASMHLGKLYHLADASSQKKFARNPDRYIPQFGGLCTTALGGSYNNRIPADPTVFEIREGKLYLFSSDRARNAYVRRPEWFIGRAEAEFVEPQIDGYCPVSFQRRIKALKGRNDISFMYGDKTYYFANNAARREFIRKPKQYSPAYDGYCAENVIKGRRYPVDPQYFFVSGNRTFLFADESALLRFTMTAANHIKKADARWAKDQLARAKPKKKPGPNDE